MRIKFNLLRILLLSLFCTSLAFGIEDDSRQYLPQDKNNTILKKVEIHGEPIYGHYLGKDGYKYSITVKNFTKEDKFISEIYRLFGFFEPIQYLISASDVISDSGMKNLNVSTDHIILVTKIDPTAKPINIYSLDKNLQEQLAKLHIVSALVGSSTIYHQNNDYCDLLVKDQKIHFIRSKINFEDYGSENEVVELKKFIEPQHGFIMAQLFQKPFKEYTQKHIQETINWLDAKWDENKIEAIYKQTGLSDEKFLNKLKLRFNSIKKQLMAMESTGYQVYDVKKFSNIIKANQASRTSKYIAKHVVYKFKNTLPKVEEQIFVCNDGTTTWLELTNFEFLINNNKESNNIVTVYIGDVGDIRNSVKQPLEIFDPETAFVWQDAIVRYWDKGFEQNSKADNLANLARAIQVGFAAVSYHFGFPNSFSLKPNFNENTTPQFHEDFRKIYTSLYQRYAENAKKIDRYVDRETINSKAALGFTAYYPNPFYLGDISQYLRPSEMSYNEYINKTRNSRYENSIIDCDQPIISKSWNANDDCCYSYTPILEKVFPGSNESHVSPHYTELLQKFTYVFRGDKRGVEEIHRAEGFWPKPCFKNDTREFIADISRWDQYRHVHGSASAYVSTSLILTSAQNFGNNTYAIFAKNGLRLSESKNHNYIDEQEVSLPGGTDWNNIVGVRAAPYISLGEDGSRPGRKNHLCGPVFLKDAFHKDDRENFWKILHIMGGKLQCSIDRYILQIRKLYFGLMNAISANDFENVLEEGIIFLATETGLNEQDLRNNLMSSSFDDLSMLETKIFKNRCES